MSDATLRIPLLHNGNTATEQFFGTGTLAATTALCFGIFAMAKANIGIRHDDYFVIFGTCAAVLTGGMVTFSKVTSRAGPAAWLEATGTSLKFCTTKGYVLGTRSWTDMKYSRGVVEVEDEYGSKVPQYPELTLYLDGYGALSLGVKHRSELWSGKVSSVAEPQYVVEIGDWRRLVDLVRFAPPS